MHIWARVQGATLSHLHSKATASLSNPSVILASQNIKPLIMVVAITQTEPSAFSR